MKFTDAQLARMQARADARARKAHAAGRQSEYAYWGGYGKAIANLRTILALEKAEAPDAHLHP